MVKIHYSKLRAFALILLLLPTLIFFVTWLKLGIALVASTILVIAVVMALKTEDEIIEFKWTSLLFLAIGIAIWVYLAGLGGFFSQKSDHIYRNPIFRDLINYQWPVRYHNEADEGMVYYIGYWLIPALFGKFFKAVSGADAGWLAGRIALFVWSFIMIYTIILLVCFKLKSGSKRAVYLIFVVFVFFSGMDALGIKNADITYHIEWWSSNMQFSSMTTQLFWVFNQAVPTWLAMALTINERDERAYALIGMGLLSTSPLPIVGLAAYMVYKAVVQFVAFAKKKEINKYIKRVATIPNILAIVSILPIYGLYYRDNYASSGSLQVVGEQVASAEKNSVIVFLAGYVAFILVEFAFLLLLLVNKKNKHEAIYSFVFLLLAPLVKIGTGLDFCMRASIPALFIIMILQMEYFYDMLEHKEKRVHLQSLCLVIVFFLVGAVTPMVEICNNVRRYVESDGESVHDYDFYNSLMDSSFDGRINFVCVNADETPFFRYLAETDT